MGFYTHTTVLTGSTLAEVARLAKERGHNVLVVTDHDAIAGADEARCAGSELDLRVMRRVEMSAQLSHFGLWFPG